MRLVKFAIISITLFSAACSKKDDGAEAQEVPQPLGSAEYALKESFRRIIHKLSQEPALDEAYLHGLAIGDDSYYRELESAKVSSFSYDITSTNSIIRPYMAYVRFNVKIKRRDDVVDAEFLDERRRGTTMTTTMERDFAFELIFHFTDGQWKASSYNVKFIGYKWKLIGEPNYSEIKSSEWRDVINTNDSHLVLIKSLLTPGRIYGAGGNGTKLGQ